MAQQPFNIYTFSFPVDEGDSLLSIKTGDGNKLFVNISLSEYEDGNRNFEDEHSNVVTEWTKETPKPGYEVLATNKDGESIYFDREEAEAIIRGDITLQKRGGGIVNEDTVKAYADDQLDLLKSYYGGEWTNQALDVSLVNREGEFVDADGNEIDDPIGGFTTFRSDIELNEKLELLNGLIDDTVSDAGYTPNHETRTLERKEPEIKSTVPEL